MGKTWGLFCDTRVLSVISMKFFLNSERFHRERISKLSIFSTSARHMVTTYTTSGYFSNSTDFSSLLATHFFFSLSQLIFFLQPIRKIKMETKKVNKINQTEETQRWVVFGYGSDDFWDTIEKLKVNFSNGLLKGLEETLKDVFFWVISWKIWEVYNVRDWIRHLLTLVEKSIWILEGFYYKIFHHQWMPIFIQNRVDLLKIHVRLEKLANFVHSKNEMLEKPTPKELIEMDEISEPEVKNPAKKESVRKISVDSAEE